MTTLTGLRDEIVTDLNRTDITAAAESALQYAKKHYEVERWWFNERRATFGTTPDQERIPLPEDYLELDSLVITYSSHTYPLDPISKKEMDVLFIQGSTYTSIPESYAIYDSQVRLYPIPDATYSVTMSYQFIMADMTASTSNVWTNELGQLIKYRAESKLYMNYMHNPQMAQVASMQENDELKRLRQRNQKYFVEPVLSGWI